MFTSVVIERPANNDEIPVTDRLTVAVLAIDPSGIAAIEIRLDGQPVAAHRVFLNEYEIALGTTGRHRIPVFATDFAGNTGASAVVEVLAYRESISRELTLTALDRAPGSLEALSRELTVVARDLLPGAVEAVSRELTVTAMDFPPGAREAVSRELTVVARDLPPGAVEAVSRELTVVARDLPPGAVEAVSRELTVRIVAP